MSDNLEVTIEKLLSFWSQHTTIIIESLLGVVILSSLFLAYRSFFGAKPEETAPTAGANLDTAQLEKTLQKILEAQSHAPAKTADDGAAVHVAVPVIESSGEATPETIQLRAALSDSAKKLEILQAQLVEAQARAEAAKAAPAASGDAGISAVERDEFNAKIRDLEARLAEYEIISEDIADLSKYREENEDLKKQLEALKAGGVSTAAPIAAAVAPPPVAPVPAAPEPVAAEPVVTESKAAPEPELVPEPATPAAPPVTASEPELDPFDIAALSVESEAAAMAPPAPTPEENASADLIDDELMKEFAAAVEGQKSLTKVAAKAGDGTAAPEPAADDTDKLMDQFENFVTKKS